MRGDPVIEDVEQLRSQIAALEQLLEVHERTALEQARRLEAVNQVLKNEVLEHKRTEEELHRTMRAAEAANRAKSEFLANMSHELRTPLNSIIGFSGILLKNKAGNLRDQDLMYLDRVLDNGKHLLTLINQVLDLSKVEAGHMELERAAVSLDLLVRETIRQMEGHAREKEVRLLAELPEAMAPLLTDAAKLKQVLINLVGNALKFTEKGSVTVRVGIDPRSRQPVRIDVTDTGIGIPTDQMAAIFEAFHQIDTTASRQFGGTGLGLTISRALCQRMGYRLEVASTLGQGATFSVVLADLPASAEVAALTEFPPVSPPGEVEMHPEELQDKLVLAIDDEADSRLVLTQYLADFGCQVVAAASGDQGLRLARERHPDLVTLDLLMPRMNGWEFLRELRADPRVRDIPVVVVSIVASENRKINFGVIDVLDKPVTRENLALVLRRTLRPDHGKVLIVEDEEDARRLLSAYLSEKGREIRAASNGYEALEVLKGFFPDLVILDLMMPVMDGLSFLEEVRKDPRYLHLPIVVVTAKELTNREVQRLDAEALAVLKKGDRLDEELHRLLEAVLARKRCART